MNDSSKVWLPKGFPPATAQALSVVDPGRPMGRSLFLDLLTAKLDTLVRADPKAARQALEMSQEEAPALWSIAEQYPVNEWASALVRSDQMTKLLAPLSMEGSLANPKPQSFLEILELLA